MGGKVVRLRVAGRTGDQQQAEYYLQLLDEMRAMVLAKLDKLLSVTSAPNARRNHVIETLQGELAEIVGMTDSLNRLLGSG
jgi:hypothetical protein